MIRLGDVEHQAQIKNTLELLRTANEKFAALVAERDDDKLLSKLARTPAHELQAIVLGRVIAARMGTDRAQRHYVQMRLNFRKSLTYGQGPGK